MKGEYARKIRTRCEALSALREIVDWAEIMSEGLPRHECDMIDEISRALAVFIRRSVKP